MEEFLQIGVISSTHGVRGEVKVYPTTDDVNRYKKLKEVVLDTGKEKIVCHPEGVKFFKQFVILKLKEFNSINDVEALKGKALLVTRKDAVKLKKDEYFIADLIGLTVVDEKDEFIGTMIDVMQTGANDVYVVEDEQHKELLFPAIKECILGIDMQQKKIKVHIMEGLLDD